MLTQIDVLIQEMDKLKTTTITTADKELLQNVWNTLEDQYRLPMGEFNEWKPSLLNRVSMDVRFYLDEKVKVAGCKKKVNKFKLMDGVKVPTEKYLVDDLIINSIKKILKDGNKYATAERIAKDLGLSVTKTSLKLTWMAKYGTITGVSGQGYRID